MFTLEDLDLGTDLEHLNDTLGVRADHGFSDHHVVDQDVPDQDGAEHRVAEHGVAEHGGTVADADARLHPADYFIAGV